MIQTLVRKIVVYEDKIEIYYNYTDETNPGDNNPRDTYLLSGSDSSVIQGSNPTNPNQNKKNYPGSDSSVIQGSNPTNPNQNKKNYPGSDSSVMVDKNHTNPNPLCITEKWICAVCPLPSKL